MHDGLLRFATLHDRACPELHERSDSCAEVQHVQNEQRLVLVMADSGDGLDLLLALADDPQHDDDPRPVMEQRIESLNTAEPNIAEEDDMDILCRMADEAEDAMVPGSPGAADVPFDPDHDVPSESPHPDALVSSQTALQSKARLPAHSGLTSAQHKNTSASAANGQQTGESCSM